MEQGMGTGKRALIVDDSRSARVILSRMLEQHGLVVDTAESAEQALEYLQKACPDVIFMDHLMPGMDGFQAVQTIKADPRTATIPLMMYTSQEGELYVSQARALGAVGVLPKTVRPVDVSRILYQLHLLPDRRTERTTLFQRVAAPEGRVRAEAGPEAAVASETGSPHQAGLPPQPGPAAAGPVAAGPAAGASQPWGIPPVALSEMQASLRQSLSQLVKDQLGEHRRFVLATFEAFARRMGGELKEGLAKVPPAPVVEPATPPRPSPAWWPVVLTAFVGVVPAVVLGWFLSNALESNARLGSELAKAQADAAAARSAFATLQAARAEAPPEASAVPIAEAPAPAPAGRHPAGPGQSMTDYVPYGEAPLANTRLERLRGLAATLEAQRFRGTIRVETFVGDFCLTGNANEGFSVADADLPAPKCDLVGNPFDDGLSAAQRQSVDFANFVSALRQRTRGAINVEVVNFGHRGTVAYPEQGEKTTAGQWNISAAQNNRVEFRVQPEA
jgi:CheY-like chemotaxis protein